MIKPKQKYIQVCKIIACTRDLFAVNLMHSTKYYHLSLWLRWVSYLFRTHGRTRTRLGSFTFSPASCCSQSIIMASTDAKRNPTLLHKLASRAAFVKAPDAIQTQSKGFRWTAPGWLSQGAETLQRLGKHIVDKANRNASRTDLAQVGQKF